MFDTATVLYREEPKCDVASRSDDAILARIVVTFHRCFYHSERTELIFGAGEPYYAPAESSADMHRIFSRDNYVASALHEVAHWCVAGAARRLLPDFGYWYAADGRNREQQRQFERVEVRPQAIEWAFSRAAGLRFRVSIDNLNGDATDPFGFQLAVWQQACIYHAQGLPPRAARFEQALRDEFAAPVSAPHFVDICTPVVIA